MTPEPEQGQLNGTFVCDPKKGTGCGEELTDRDLILTVLNRQIDVIQRLTKIEDKVTEISEHTTTMNKELGECVQSLKSCQETITKLQKKRLHLPKISHWTLGSIIAILSFLFTVITWLITHGMLKL